MVSLLTHIWVARPQWVKRRLTLVRSLHPCMFRPWYTFFYFYHMVSFSLFAGETLNETTTREYYLWAKVRFCVGSNRNVEKEYSFKTVWFTHVFRVTLVDVQLAPILHDIAHSTVGIKEKIICSTLSNHKTLPISHFRWSFGVFITLFCGNWL